MYDSIRIIDIALALGTFIHKNYRTFLSPLSSYEIYIKYSNKYWMSSSKPSMPLW